MRVPAGCIQLRSLMAAMYQISGSSQQLRRHVGPAITYHRVQHCAVPPGQSQQSLLCLQPRAILASWSARDCGRCRAGQAARGGACLAGGCRGGPRIHRRAWSPGTGGATRGRQGRPDGQAEGKSRLTTSVRRRAAILTALSPPGTAGWGGSDAAHAVGTGQRGWAARRCTVSELMSAR